MNKLFKIVIWIWLIGLMTGTVFVQAQSCETMIYDLNLSTKENHNVRKLTNEFCEEISKSKCVHDGELFDANQSVFLTLLCDNVWAGNYFTSIDREDLDSSILLKTWFKQFGIFDYWFWDREKNEDGEKKENFFIDACDYNQSLMNGCNLAEQLPKMFDEIMNDYFNIKQADLYWVDSLDDDRTDEEIANLFANNNYPWLWEVWTFDPSICDPTSDYYGDACKSLKGYMKGAKNLLKQTKVINLKNLEVFWSDNTILYFGLLWDEVTPKMAFLNAVYNEYLWYRLFISYYSYELSVDYRYSDLDTKDQLDKQKSNREKIYSFQEQLFRTRQAMSLAVRSMSEISSSFAIHIGFLMYQEDAQLFMKKVAKIYSPIMTLYDKLRNVQKAE